MAGTIAQKLKTMYDALETLQDSIELYTEEKSGPQGSRAYRYKLATRDSMIQRFEYCSDLFWKLIKQYLEELEKLPLEANAPRSIMREASSAKILSEQEAEDAVAMIGKRNQTSHIYHQDLANEIAMNVAGYYRFMKNIVDRLAKKIK